MEATAHYLHHWEKDKQHYKNEVSVYTALKTDTEKSRGWEHSFSLALPV